MSAPKEGKSRESQPGEPGRDRNQQSAVDQARQPRATHPEQRQSAGRGIERAQSRGLAGERGIVGVAGGDELPGREPEQSEERDELPDLPRARDGDRRGRCRDQQDDRGGTECRRVVAAGPEDEHACNRKRKSTCSGWDDRRGGRPLHLSFAGRTGQRPQKGVRRARSRSARPAPSPSLADSRTCDSASAALTAGAAECTSARVAWPFEAPRGLVGPPRRRGASGYPGPSPAAKWQFPFAVTAGGKRGHDQRHVPLLAEAGPAGVLERDVLTDPRLVGRRVARAVPLDAFTDRLVRVETRSPSRGRVAASSAASATSRGKNPVRRHLHGTEYPMSGDDPSSGYSACERRKRQGELGR